MKRHLLAIAAATSIGLCSGAKAAVFQNGSFELGIANIGQFATLNAGDNSSISWGVGFWLIVARANRFCGSRRQRKS
jgi:hypothetical protein